MKRLKFLSVMILAAAVSLTACNRDDPDSRANAADPGALPAMLGQDMDPQTVQLVMELQTIQQQLAPLQEEALQDPGLAAQLAALQGQVEAAMQSEDPTLFERIAAVETEMMEAQASGDQARLQAAGQAAQSVQQSIEAVETAVLARNEIREPMEAFEAAFRARMIQINPEAEALFARAEEIMEQLRR
jgi:hypothetical protein